MTDHATKIENYTANEYGGIMTVSDDIGGGVWWPSAEAIEEIDAGSDRAATAIKICHETPERGEWRS